MARKLFLMTFTLIMQVACILAQTSEIECSVNKKNGCQLVLTPAYFDPSILPDIGDKVHLMLLIKSDLPEGKPQGYYELFTMDVVKITAENKSIIFKCDEDMDAAKLKTGIPGINLNSSSKVRIRW